MTDTPQSKEIEQYLEEFKTRHPSVFWGDAVHCTCFNEDTENNIPPLPEDVLAFLRQSLESYAKAQREEGYTEGYQSGFDAGENYKKQSEG